jgi:hypothetical protein
MCRDSWISFLLAIYQNSFIRRNKTLSNEMLKTNRDLEALMPLSKHPKENRFALRALAQFVAIVGLLATGYRYFWHLRSHSLDHSFASSDGDVIAHGNRLEEFQQCAISKLLDTGLPFLKKASPIAVQDFQERRDRLAEALVAEDVDAFVVEPGYTFKYYGNVSQPEWEVWEVSRNTNFKITNVKMLMEPSQRSAHS